MCSLSDDNESLAGLTQVPSQKPVLENGSSDSSDDEFSGLFNLKPAQDILDCSANVEADFSQFVTGIMSETESANEDEKISSHEVSTEDVAAITSLSTELFDNDEGGTEAVCFAFKYLYFGLFFAFSL